MQGEDLSELLARVEAATEPDREIDCAIAVTVDGHFIDGKDFRGRPIYCRRDPDGAITSPGQGHDMLVRRYTASVDAALALVERAGDGYRLYSVDASIPGRFSVVLKGPDRLWPADEDSEACVAPGWESGASASLPLALCAALLRSQGSE